MESIFENLENLTVSEECFNDIMDIVEEIINERNKENRQAKKEYELNRTPKLHNFSKDGLAGVNQATIRNLKKYDKVEPDEKDAYFKQREIDSTVNALASNNRALLGRGVESANYPYEHKKKNEFGRKEGSQKDSPKDEISDKNDSLQWKRFKGGYSPEKFKERIANSLTKGNK